MKCDELKIQKIGDICFDFKMGKNIEPYYYAKSQVDKVIAELKKEIKRTQENVCRLEQLFQKKKDNADKLISCLKYLVMRDLIKDCTEKAYVIAMVKELQRSAMN